MPITLGTKAVDRSAYVIRVNFKDEDSVAVIPNSIKWTLTDEGTVVINSRTCVAIAVPAATVDILLKGDDLKYSDGKTRTLYVSADYDSTLGTAIPLREEVRFYISDLLNIGS
jgi:hypothetical protein